MCQEFSYDELNQFGIPAEEQVHFRKFDENQYDGHHPNCNTCSETLLARFKSEERKLAKIKRQIMELQGVQKIDTWFRDSSKQRKIVQQILVRTKERVFSNRRKELRIERLRIKKKKLSDRKKKVLDREHQKSNRFWVFAED